MVGHSVNPTAKMTTFAVPKVGNGTFLYIYRL